MPELRQSTSKVVRIGPFLNSTDGITPEPGLTIAQADMQISKDGAAFAQKNSAGNATHDTDGFYFTTFDVTDTDTTAIIEFQINVTGALPFFKTYTVVTQTFFDAKYTGTFNNLGGVAQVADNDTKLSSILSDTGTTLPAQITGLNNFDPANEAVANVTLVATTTTNTDMRGTDGANTVVPPSVAQLNARTILSAEYATSSNLSTVDTVVDAIKVTTDQLTFTISNELDVNMLTHTATIPTNYITSTGVASSALDGKGNWNIGKTGYSILGSLQTLDVLQNISVSNIFSGGDIDGLDLEESLKLILAGAAGKTSGMDTGTAVIQAFDDSKPRITATVDINGNRSTVITDVTG